MLAQAATGWTTTQFLAALSVVSVLLTAVIMALAFRLDLFRGKREKRDVAREEALELAETRGKVITDLREEVAHLSDSLKRVRDELDRAREDAWHTQQMLSRGVQGIFAALVDYLEEEPPKVQEALALLRDATVSVDTLDSRMRRR